MVTAVNHTECLAKLQRGEADAITGDDTVLAGLAAQDPYAVVPEQDAFTAEPYGIAVNEDDRSWSELINAVLEEMRADGVVAGQLRHVAGAHAGRGDRPAPAGLRALMTDGTRRSGRDRPGRSSRP